MDVLVGEWPGDPRAFNALCVLPVGSMPRGYDRLVLAGAPGECAGAGTELWRLEDAADWPGRLPDLEAMRGAYRALMRVMRRPAWCRNMWQLSHMVAEEAGIDDVGAAASILAMADMGLFTLQLEGDALRLSRSDRPKASPEESPVWNLIQRWRGGIL